MRGRIAAIFTSKMARLSPYKQPTRSPQQGGLPNCLLKKNGDGVRTLWFQPACTVQMDGITRYSWKVNGSANTVTATSLSFPAAQIPGVRSVEVTATTDKGQVGVAIFDLSTGQSTPLP